MKYYDSYLGISKFSPQFTGSAVNIYSDHTSSWWNTTDSSFSKPDRIECRKQKQWCLGTNELAMRHYLKQNIYCLLTRYILIQWDVVMHQSQLPERYRHQQPQLKRTTKMKSWWQKINLCVPHNKSKSICCCCCCSRQCGMVPGTLVPVPYSYCCI